MTLTSDEGFRTAYYYFIYAVTTLASNPDEACDRMGDYNVAWEVKDDVQAGRYLVEWELLPTQAKADIWKLINALDKIPQELLISAQGRQRNLQAMSDEVWTPIRAEAATLIATLSLFTEANNAKFLGGG